MRRGLVSIFGFSMFVYGRFDAEGSKHAWIAIWVAAAAVLIDGWWPERKKEGDRG